MVIDLAPGLVNPRRPPTGLPLLRLGFRPFYLLAAAFAAAAMALWVARYRGWVPGSVALPAALWHAHEMVFGFALAVVTGFLFTAVRNWTGLATPSGARLAGFALLWIAGRVAFLASAVGIGVALDLAFAGLVSGTLGALLMRAGNQRNYFIALIVGAFTVADLAFFAGWAALLPIDPYAPVRLALFLVLMLATVMGGRVIPMFTANALRQPARPVAKPLEIAVLATTAIAIAATLVLPVTPVAAAACAAAAVLHAMRAARWSPLSTRRVPLLWVLHAAYAWIPAGFGLLALAALGLASPALALHAFTAGAIGGLTIGMMTRTALGHTGRPLTAGRSETAMFVLVHAAALVRVFGPLVAPARYAELVLASGVLWSAAFLLYFVVYAPRLAAARVDGRDG